MKFKVFKNPNFSKMWFAQTFSRFGDNIEYIALILLVYQLTNSTISIGLIAILSTIPNILLTAFGGAFADRYSKKKIMVVCDLSRSILILSVPMAYYFNMLVPLQLYIVTFLCSVFESFNTPTQNSTLIFLVKKEEFIDATSIMSISFQVISILGLTVGGILVGFVGFIGAFLLDSISFLLSALTIHSLIFEDKSSIVNENNLFKDICNGIKMVNNNYILKFSLCIFLFLGIMVGPLDVTIPYFINENYNNTQIQSTYIGFIFGFLSLGIILGSFFIKSLIKKLKLILTIISCLILIALTNIILAYAKNVIFLMISTLLLGFFTSILRILVITKSYEIVEPKYRGRFVSLITLITLSANPTMAFLISFILKYAQLKTVYMVIFFIGISYITIISIVFWKFKHKKCLKGVQE